MGQAATSFHSMSAFCDKTNLETHCFCRLRDVEMISNPTGLCRCNLVHGVTTRHGLFALTDMQ